MGFNSAFNIILTPTPGSSKWPLSLRFPRQTPVRTSPPYVLHGLPILFFSVWSPEYLVIIIIIIIIIII